MLEKAVVLCSQQCIDEALRDLFELQRLSLLFPELPDQCAIAAEHTHGGAQGDVAERTFLWEVWAEIEVQPCQPPDCRTGYQRAISHHFLGFWHLWTLRRIVCAVGPIGCIRQVGDPST